MFIDEDYKLIAAIFYNCNLASNNPVMKSIALGQDLHEFHQKCVCQICSCQKHKCPHSDVTNSQSRSISPIQK
jgi:hypothetical protein